MTIECKPVLKSNLTRTVSPTGAPDYTISYSAFDRTTGNFNASSTPPGSDCASKEITPGSGTINLDLTAIADDPTGTNRDFSGLQVVYMRLVAPSTNTDPITISDGASNEYPLNAGNDIVLDPGVQADVVFGAALGDVGASAKAIDVVGTTAGDKLQYLFVAG